VTNGIKKALCSTMISLLASGEGQRKERSWKELTRIMQR
jgi:hypothetical protein